MNKTFAVRKEILLGVCARLYFFINPAQKKRLKKTNIIYFRYPKKENFTVVSNHFIYDSNLTGTAKGLFLFILSCDRKNSTWILYKSEILKHFKEGKDAINSAFDNLEKNGYLEVDKKKKGKKTLLSFIVYEIPKEKFELKINSKPEEAETVCADSSNGMSGFSILKNDSCSENPTLLNTILINTTTNKGSSSEFLKSVMKKMNIKLSDSFYSSFTDFCDERKMSEEQIEDYISWIVNEKGKTVRNMNSFIFTTAAEPGLYDEYLQDNKKTKTQNTPFEQIVCKKCGKVQSFQEMREASCRGCGTDYFDFSKYRNINAIPEEVHSDECDAGL